MREWLYDILLLLLCISYIHGSAMGSLITMYQLHGSAMGSLITMYQLHPWVGHGFPDYYVSVTYMGRPWVP